MERIEPGIYREVLKSGADRFHAYWREEGKQIHRVARSKTQARNMRAQGRVNNVTGERTSSKRGTPMSEVLEGFYSWSVDRGRAPNTLEGHRRAIDLRLAPSFGGRAASTISASDIESAILSWKKDRKRPAGDATISAAMNTLSGAFRWACRQSPPLAMTNPAREVERPKPAPKTVRAFTDREVQAIAQHMPDVVDRAILFTLATTGLRIGELFALRIENIRPDGLHIVGSRRKGGEIGPVKGRKARVARLSTAARSNVAALVGGRTDGYLIQAQGDKPANYSNWRKRKFDSARIAAELSQGRPHDLRHTYATQAIEEGASVLHVQNQLGHAKPSITLDVYASHFSARDTDLVDRMGARQAEFVA